MAERATAKTKGEVRIGLEGVLFKSLKQPQISRSGDNQFPAFRGLGCEVTWKRHHIEAGLEADEFVVSNSSVESPDQIIFIKVSPRIAYRLTDKRTPYLGVGFGYQWARIESFSFFAVYGPYWVRSLSVEPYFGYDYPVTGWLGFKLEGGMQVLKPQRATFAQGFGGRAVLYLALGGE